MVWKIMVDFDGHLLQQLALNVAICKNETLLKSSPALHRLTRTAAECTNRISSEGNLFRPLRAVLKM